MHNPPLDRYDYHRGVVVGHLLRKIKEALSREFKLHKLSTLIKVLFREL
jgi:hypothetical protein